MTNPDAAPTQAPPDPFTLRESLTSDPDPAARARALEALAAEPIPWCWEVLAAGNDPAPAVRAALQQCLHAFEADPFSRDVLRHRLETAARDDARFGDFLHPDAQEPGAPAFRTSPLPERSPPLPWEALPTESRALAVRQWTETQRLRYLSHVPHLLLDPDEATREAAAEILAEHGSAPELLLALELADDPRQGGLARVLGPLVPRLQPVVVEELTQQILEADHPPAGAIAFALQVCRGVALSQGGLATLRDGPFRLRAEQIQLWRHHRSPRVRALLARLLSLGGAGAARAILEQLLHDDDPAVALAALEGLLLQGAELPEISIEWLRTTPPTPRAQPLLRQVARIQLG